MTVVGGDGDEVGDEEEVLQVQGGGKPRRGSASGGRTVCPADVLPVASMLGVGGHCCREGCWLHLAQSRTRPHKAAVTIEEGGEAVGKGGCGKGGQARPHRWGSRARVLCPASLSWPPLTL
ncbi:hypothetical protein E2562_035040 [Oryza meyeriana var. granulata]|uniref:Uncharacterized protein n=1 Tax=Oryza meyeriana var. granulata TaxID=110450 RepID=A0A6G1EBE7_9ORYZ|nr:hypothetical protein E2562_035040 [Oryza meyeriana var. granulata]